jgi:GT2 family glycosyltransferase
MGDVVLSVVVCTRNSADRIDALLEALMHQETPVVAYEVIVVDGHSTDGTVDRVARHPVRLVQQGPRPGIAAARNDGLDAARGQVVCYVDDDCLPERDWLRRVHEALERHPEAAGVGGGIKAYRLETIYEKYAALAKNPLYGHIPSVAPTKRVSLYLRKAFGVRPPPLKEGQLLDSVMTANAAFRVEALREVGGFDPSLSMAEDWDLCLRMREAGHALLYAPQAKVRHRHRPTASRFFRHVYAYGRAYARLTRKHREVRLIPYPMPVLLAGLLTGLAFGLPWWLPLTIPLLYLLKDLPYTLGLARRLRDARIPLAFPLVEFAREVVYNLGILAGLLSRRPREAEGVPGASDAAVEGTSSDTRMG